MIYREECKKDVSSAKIVYGVIGGLLGICLAGIVSITLYLTVVDEQIQKYEDIRAEYYKDMK